MRERGGLWGCGIVGWWDCGIVEVWCEGYRRRFGRDGFGRSRFFVRGRYSILEPFFERSTRVCFVIAFVSLSVDLFVAFIINFFFGISFPSLTSPSPFPTTQLSNPDHIL